MLLEVQGIKKYFSVRGGSLGASRGVVTAVDGVDLTINEGEHVSLVGESGCGKTTLARIILNLIEPDEGVIMFEGKDVAGVGVSGGEKVEFRKRLQMVFQDPYSSLDPRFTIRQVMDEALTLARDQYPTSLQRRERAEHLLGSVGLTGDILSRYPHEFSGGERQRIAIARALMINPKLLILDEAVSALDVIIQKQLIELLAQLQAAFSLTYLFISHNLKIVRKISHKIGVMYRGRIVEWGPVAEIFGNPLHPYTKELLAAAIDYQVVKGDREILVDPKGVLVDHGNGHFVLGF